MGELSAGVKNGVTETVVKLTRFAFCNLSETATIFAGRAVEAPSQGAEPIMVRCQVWPRLINDASKFGTEITFALLKGMPNVPD